MKALFDNIVEHIVVRKQLFLSNDKTLINCLFHNTIYVSEIQRNREHGSNKLDNENVGYHL